MDTLSKRIMKIAAEMENNIENESTLGKFGDALARVARKIDADNDEDSANDLFYDLENIEAIFRKYGEYSCSSAIDSIRQLMFNVIHGIE